MNDQSNQFNNEQCPGQLGGDGDETNLDKLQAFSINFTFRDIPKHKTGIVLKAFIIEWLTKDNSMVLHPTNRQTLPTPAPFSTAEKTPPTTDRFLEFFHTVMTQRGMTVYYTVKSTITIMQLRNRVLPFMKNINLWMDYKQISDNRPMDAAIIKDTTSMAINIFCM